MRDREKLRTAFGALLMSYLLYWRKTTYVCGVCDGVAKVGVGV